MTLWWIGNLILLAVVAPVVLYLLNNLWKPVQQIGAAADGILAGGATIANQLDMLGGLTHTSAAIKKIGAGVGQYGAALDKIL
jgi:hypothetical protein